MNSKGIFPCKNCNDRAVGCHGRCEKYKEAKEQYNKKAEEVRRTKKYINDVDNFIIGSIIKRESRNNKIYR